MRKQSVNQKGGFQEGDDFNYNSNNNSRPCEKIEQLENVMSRKMIYQFLIVHLLFHHHLY